MTLKTKFDLSQKVYITELGKWGKVIAIYLGKVGLEYNVRYFDNAEGKTLYFFEDELTDKEPEKKIGIK